MGPDHGTAGCESVPPPTRVRTVLARPPLIDIGNAVNERLDLIYADLSLGERLQHALPDTCVVKTLNTVGGPIGVQPGLLPSPTDVFLSGDDTEANAVVAPCWGSSTGPLSTGSTWARSPPPERPRTTFCYSRP